MNRKFLLPAFAVLGILLGIGAVLLSARKHTPNPIPFPPPKPPFTHFIAGEGVIEASSENIQIGTPFNELCTDVYVAAGAWVKAGDPLFTIDTQTLEAQLCQAVMDREAAVVDYENLSTQLKLYDRVTDRRAVSENEYNQVYFAAESAKVAIQQAEARMGIFQTNIGRSTIRAPMDGKVLQVNIRPGEVANLNPFNNVPLIYFGPVCPPHVRVNIDEDDAWRFKEGAPGMAYVRGNSSICFQLKYVRTEPLMIPKQSLTGSATERVDTRVMQAVYEFTCEALPVFMGQLVDVYIESIPANTRYGNGQKTCR